MYLFENDLSRWDFDVVETPKTSPVLDDDDDDDDWDDDDDDDD